MIILTILNLDLDFTSRMLSGSNYLVTVVEVLQNNQDLKLDEESPEVIFIIQGHIIPIKDFLIEFGKPYLILIVQ